MAFRTLRPVRATTFAIAAFWAATLPLFAQEVPLKTEPIEIEGGRIVGAVVPGDPEVRAYRGIPFAAPPVGERRWKAPAPVEPWEGVRECLEDGDASPQNRPPLPLPGLAPSKTSEDCLHLNVFTAAESADAKLPVMVWIHGGGFIMGYGGGEMYDGTNLARSGVVLVAINYRLGAFGYMGHPALSADSPSGTSGNYGLLDQIEALKWVKKNVAAFGGDPDNVTVFGESAGSISVAMLMVSPLSKGLFHRAISQSGGAYGTMNRHLREAWHGIEPVESQGVAIAARMGLPAGADAAALRATTTEQVMKATAGAREISGELISAKNFPFWPTVDGWAIPDDPGAIFDRGEQHDVPYMAGSNADEGTMFLVLFPARDTSVFEPLARSMFGPLAGDVLATYPADDSARMKDSLNRIVTDFAFLTPARLMARAMEKKKSPGYLYHFVKRHERGFGAALGAHHAAEIPYVFGTLAELGVGDEGDAALGEKMRACWVEFARTGVPGGEGLPEWPAYDAKTDVHMEFGETVETKSGLRKKDTELMERAIARAMANRAGAGAPESAVGE